MRTEAKTKIRTVATILGSIKEAMKAVFETKNDTINNMEDVNDWDEYVKNVDKYSDDDRDVIKAIMQEEKKIKKRAEQIRNSKKSLENQRVDPKHRPNINAKIVERNDKELV